MVNQILKVIPSYLTKTQAQNVKSFQKKTAVQKDGYILTIEIVDSYKFYKLSKGYSKITTKLGCPPLNTFMVHLIYTKIEDLPQVKAHKKEMIIKSASKKTQVSQPKPVLIVSFPYIKSASLVPYKYYNQILDTPSLIMSYRA